MAQILVFVLASIWLSCGSSKFQGGGSTAQPKSATKEAEQAAGSVAQEPLIATQEFNVEKITSQAKIDMVWLIDNSGSMSEEAAQVRANFARFVKSVSAIVDIRVSLISISEEQVAKRKAEADAAVPKLNIPTLIGLTLPAEFANSASIKQYSTTVDSTNALAIAAVASCPASESDLAPLVLNPTPPAGSTPPAFKACGSSLTMTSVAQRRGAIEAPANVQSPRGIISERLRADAKRVYVVVTDDLPSGIDEKNFISTINGSKNAPAESPAVFAFRSFGPSTSGCNPGNNTVFGAQYETLAKATGGSTFDICEPDWSTQFDKLVTQVVELAKPTIDMTDLKILKVMELFVDDVLIPADSYSLEGRTVHFKAGAVKKNSKKFKIKFQREV